MPPLRVKIPNVTRARAQSLTFTGDPAAVLDRGGMDDDTGTGATVGPILCRVRDVTGEYHRSDDGNKPFAFVRLYTDNRVLFPAIGSTVPILYDKEVREFTVTKAGGEGLIATQQIDARHRLTA